MLTYPVAWIVAAVVFAGMDATWLSVMTSRLYRPLIGQHLAARFDYGAAIAFYLLYITGLVILAVAPALEKRSLIKALQLGAILGLVAYGAYDLTNQASLKDWDIRLTLADMAWGAVASSAGAAAAYLAAARFT